MEKWMNNITEVREISGRVMLVTLAAAGGDLHFVSVYAPPADHKPKKKRLSTRSSLKQYRICMVLSTSVGTLTQECTKHVIHKNEGNM